MTKKTGTIFLAVGVVAVASGVASLFVAGREAGPAPSARPSDGSRTFEGADIAAGLVYVGRAACTECHAKEVKEWTGSHHDRAMEEPTAATVEGDFNDLAFTHFGTTTTFRKKGDEFWVNTDGPDGKPADYKVAYTFGAYPLQQYLIAFPGGRYQALNVCWDDRPKDQGGQRWFHLYPNETVPHNDILHWTGPYQNWNHMCAECHSTNVRKNASTDGASFSTTFSELDVSCEACHGPASAHVALARRKSSDWGGSKFKGLVALLREEKPGHWAIDPATGIAKRDKPLSTQAEAWACARCHSRRGTFNEDVLPGKPPSDTHRLALVEAALYEADGQIKDEVYEYQSFTMSRMHAAGVTCSDCHNPHTLKVNGVDRNDACARCHEPTKFDTPTHTYHAKGTKGAACVECHMPTKTYMVVHERHDHSLRIPRPDLTASLGTPNACNGCHTDKTPQWAAAEIAGRTANKPLHPHFGVALAAGRSGLPEAEALLTKLMTDVYQPAVARATAVAMLGGPLEAFGDPDPIVRAAAAASVHPDDLDARIGELAPLLLDPVRQVRMDTARLLATVPDTKLTRVQSAAREAALGEYVQAQRLDADRPESHLNLGSLHAQRGQAADAEREFKRAIVLSPHFPASYVNLADLYRGLGHEADALEVLRTGLVAAPGSADIPHALGLALVRTKQLDQALPMLQRAAQLAPDVTRYAYVYGVALESAAPGSGIDALKGAHARRPTDTDVLEALISYCARTGRTAEAATYAAKLAALRPNDPAAKKMLDRLRSQQR